MNYTSKTLTNACLVLAGLLTASQSANSQTVNYEDGYATGIQNLRIDNLCYDVEFLDGSYQTVFNGQSPTFLDRPELASAAATEIRDVLNDNRKVPEINASESEVLLVPNKRLTRIRMRAALVGHDTSDDPWQRYKDFEGNVGTNYEDWEYAKFREGPSVIYAANTDRAVGIHNINIDGTCLDVRFVNSSYEDAFAERTPRYHENKARANNAANVIMNLLNAESTVPEINESENEILWIPTTRTRVNFTAEQVGHNESDAPWRRFAHFQGSVSKDYDAWDFAVFDDSLDCNRDGLVNVQDLTCTCATTNRGSQILDAIDSVLGDATGDGTVSFADFLQLSANFGQNGEYTDGDFDCDGTVTFTDFLMLSENFGHGTSSKVIDIVSIPEPSSGRLFVAILPAILLLRRRRPSGE